MATSQNRRRATLLFSLTIAICLTVLILPIAASDLYRRSTPAPEPILVSQSPPTGTYFDHLVFIIMENEGINDICGQSPPPCNGSNTPYMSALANQYGIDQQYLRVGAGTSQPQYIAIMAASQQNCTTGCGTSGTLHAVNLVDRLESAGLSWKAYMEDQGSASGCVSTDTGFYQAIHNPFVSFNDIFTNPTRCSNIILANPSGCGTTTDCGLINDLNSGSAPNFMWLTPNNCDNMHAASGCPNGCTSAFSSTCLKDGDNYLKNVANSILNSTTFKTTNSALFITFDEGNGFCPGPFPSGEDCMYNVWAGPTAKTAYSNSTLFNHYSFTKTIETNWGLSTMTSNDASATPMTAFLKTQTSADFSISASPTSVNVLASTQTTSTITLNSLNGFTGTVSLAASSSPTGPTLNLNPTSVTLTSGGSGTSTLTFTSSTTGNYTITVTGTSGSLQQHTTTVTIHVQDYSISSSPTSIKTNSGTQGTSTITVSPINHFTGTVSLSATGSTGLTVSISPTSITGGSGTATLTASSTTTGNYTAIITSTSGSLTHTLTVNVQVVGFTITATSPSPVNTGLSASSTITLTAVNHFTGTVSLTDSPPSGLTCGAITPNTITGSGTATVSCNATTFGNYTLTITGTSGSLTHTATALFQFRDYNITANPTSITANMGTTATSTMTITGQNHFAAVVNLSTNSTSCTLNPISVSGTGSSILSCTFSSAGTFHVAVTGTSGTLSHTVTLTFKIQNFTLTASPTSITVNAGSQANSTITVSSINGFAGIVDLTTNSTLCTLNPTSVTGSGSSTLSCTFMSASTIHVNVTGANGSLSHTVTLTFTVQDFTLTSSPSTVTANASAPGVSAITLSPVNGFAGMVALATNSSSCAISPNSLTGSGSSTLTCTFTTAGTRHVAVTGTSGSLSHNTTLTFKIQDFTITGSPTSLTLNVNASGNSTISIAALNGFTGVVNLATNSTSCTLSKASVTGSGTATLSCTFPTTSMFHVAVTGTSASLSHSVTVTYTVQDFGITASPTSLTTNVNATATSSISVSAVNGFAGIISLATNATSSCSVSPASVTGSGGSTLSCTFTTSGNRHVMVTGTNGGLSHSATVTIIVQNFSITSNPTSVSVNVNATGISSITITSINGFGGVVNLSTNSTSCGVSPTSVTGSGSATLSCTFAAASNVHVQLTATNGSLSHGVTVLFVVQDFTIAANPTNITVNVNASGTSTITVIGQNGFAGTVTLATNSTSCTVSPTSVTGSGTTTLSCNISTIGTFHIGVTGTNASLSHSLTVAYNVQDFTMTASPTSINVNVGATGKSTVTITAINSFNGLVGLTTNSTSCSLSPSTVSGSGSSTLSCTFASVSNVAVKIIGTNSTLSHSVTVTFTVQDFTITATAPSLANVGNSPSTTITLNSLDGFAATINLTDTIPSGLSCGTISPSAVSGSGTATLSCTASTAGNYTVTIIGTSSNLIHSINSTFRYQDYAVTASVPSIVNAHASASATLTIVYLNGFNATVNLSDSIPSGLTCSTISPSTLTGSGTAGVSCSAMAGGNYTLTLTGTSSPLTRSTTTTFRFADFTITATNPPATDIARNVNSVITVAAINQFSTMISLTTSMATGVSCNPPSPTGLPGSGISTLTCSTNTSGNYTLQIRGTAGTISHATTITIQAIDYGITSNPTSIATPVATNATSTITLTSLNGYSGNITMAPSVQTQSTTSGPGGLGGSHPFYMAAPAQLPDPIITPGSLILSSGGAGHATLTIIVPTGTQTGNYTVTITANDGALWHTIQLTLAVTDFSLTTPTTNIVQAPGTNSTTTLNLQSLNSFQGNITFSTSISPSGPTATVNPSQIFLTSASSTVLTVTVPSSTPLGNYTLTIQASSGSILHSISIKITVKIGPTNILVKMLSPSTSVPAGIGAVLEILCIVSIHAVRKGRVDDFEVKHNLIHGRRSHSNKTQWVQTSNFLPCGPVWTRLERF